jgi:hypothetical protein
MYTQVKFVLLFNNGFIKGRKQDVTVTIQVFHGGHQQTMVFTGVTINKCGG